MNKTLRITWGWADIKSPVGKTGLVPAFVAAAYRAAAADAAAAAAVPAAVAFEPLRLVGSVDTPAGASVAAIYLAAAAEAAMAAALADPAEQVTVRHQLLLAMQTTLDCMMSVCSFAVLPWASAVLQDQAKACNSGRQAVLSSVSEHAEETATCKLAEEGAMKESWEACYHARIKHT